MATYFNSNDATTGFDALAVGTLPTGARAISGSWSIQAAPTGYGHTNYLTNTTHADGNRLIFDGLTAVLDMEVLFAYVIPAGTTASAYAAPSPMLRMKADYSAGFLLIPGVNGVNPSFTLYRRTSASSDAQSGSVQSTGLTVAVGDKMWIRAQVIGNTVKARMWKDGTTEPTTWQGTWTDASASTVAGFTGFYSGKVNGNGFLDGVTDMTLTDAVAATAATALTLTGPATGTVSTASTNFTVAANGTLSANVIVTPSDSSGGGTFTPTTVTLTSAATSATFTYTPNATAGAKSITLTNNGSLTNPSAFTYTTSAAAAGTIPPNAAGILYSPCNWDVTSARAFSINPGAEFRTLFTGGSCVLNFDMTGLATPLPQISYRIDGYGPWTTVTLASTITIPIPSDIAAASSHLLQFRIKSLTENTSTGWAGNAIAVRFLGLTLAASGTVTLPNAAPLVGICYGDSILEGTRAVNNSAANDVDKSDAGCSYGLELGKLLGAEIGIIAFGGSGFNFTTTIRSIPGLPNSYNFIASGIPRVFPSNLDFVYINQGNNDGTNNTTTNVTAVLNGLLAAIPVKTKIFIARPLPGTNQATFIPAGVAACSNPSRVYYLDTAGVWLTSQGPDGLHPAAWAHIANIGPMMAAKIKPNLGARRFNITVS